MSRSHATPSPEAGRGTLRPHLVQTSAHTWVCVGEDVSNMGMIRGKDGIVIIDTGMHPECAARTLAAFRSVAPADDYPVRAVIYTHGHGDHTGGSPIFCTEGPRPEIWARANFGEEASFFGHAGLPPLFRDRNACRQGFRLPPDKRMGSGLAPVDHPSAGGTVHDGMTCAVSPDHFFNTVSTPLSIAGLELWLLSTPGETADALSVWFPEEKTLFCGDALCRSFPDICPVRGPGSRDIPSWCSSLKLMAALNPEVLIPGHDEPFLGMEQTHEVLCRYREAMEYVYDRTIAGMNEGRTPDQLVAEVRLPEHLARLDYLEERCGNVSWTVRSIFNQYAGWFDGNPLHLCSTFTNVEEARHMADLAGGEDALLKSARTALERNDAAWAARLADHLLALSPDSADYLLLKADALEVLGETMRTATGRNFTLTAAQKLRAQGRKRGM